MTVEESAIWVWRGLESFFGVKREEGGRKRSPPLKYRVSQGRPSRGAWVAFALLRARAPFPPRAPSHAPAFGVDPGGRGARPTSFPSPAPPAPAERARAGWRGRAGARGTAGARAGPGASMMEERAAAAVAAAASSCRPLGSGAGPGPTGAALVSAPAPGPGPAAKGGGGGGGSPGPAAGPEPLSLPGILHFIQHEWARFEAEKARWEAERAELQVSTAPGPPAPARPARPSLTRRRRRRHLGAMAAGTAGGAGGDGDRPGAGVRGRPRGGRRREGGPRGRREEAARGTRACWKWERAGRRKGSWESGRGAPRGPGRAPRSVGRG